MRRRRIAFLTVAAALVAATPAAAQLLPVKRTFGDLTIPRLRAGTIHVPKGHASGRVRVIVTLKLPPLAAAYSRAPFAFGGARRLDAAASPS